MRHFDYANVPAELLNYEMMNLVSAIHEYKGKQELFIEAKPDVLQAMLEIAKIQSTGASNRIEGIYTSDKRLAELVKSTVAPHNRSEQEIAGYREVLSLINENYDYMFPSANVILQLHRDLYQFNAAAYSGRFKNSDNVITESDLTGQKRVRFTPLSAFETPEAIDRLISTFTEAYNAAKYDPLLLIPMFILDFLCIHPFNDGNGRMSRLLTLLLLYRTGYIVGKYISIERLIEQTKETYYEVLQDSSIGWRAGENHYLPFVKYYLEILLRTYKDFSNRVELLRDRQLNKSERIRALFAGSLQRISKSAILEKCPDISTSTVELTLSALVKTGYILKIGSGRSTTYIRNTGDVFNSAE